MIITDANYTLLEAHTHRALKQHTHLPQLLPLQPLWLFHLGITVSALTESDQVSPSLHLQQWPASCFLGSSAAENGGSNTTQSPATITQKYPSSEYRSPLQLRQPLICKNLPDPSPFNSLKSALWSSESRQATCRTLLISKNITERPGKKYACSCCQP